MDANFLQKARAFLQRDYNYFLNAPRISASPVFGPEIDNRITQNLATELTEDDEAIDSCTGNVGGLPAGQLVWYYYPADSSVALDGSDIGTVTAGELIPAGNRSFNRTSYLRVQLNKSLNAFWYGALYSKISKTVQKAMDTYKHILLM